MEFSVRFHDMLKSIDYHLDHLPRDLFANEERLPELLPVFMWFIKNVSPKSNCVTPKELKLYSSLSSSHDHFSSLEKVSKGIEKFYDESTKDSTVCAADLEALERNIIKSQQELNNLKEQGALYEKKLYMLDDDISSLKKKNKFISISCYQMENNMNSVLKTFTEKIHEFGSNVNRLHDGIVDSMTNNDICLLKLVSMNLSDLNELRRQQVCDMIQLWFNDENDSSPESDRLFKVHTLSLIFESVMAMKQAELNANCDVLKLNLAVNNVFNIKHYYDKHKECLGPDGLDVSDYVEKFVKNQKVSWSDHQQSTSSEYDEIKSGLCDLVVSDAEKKLLKLETIEKRITFVHDSVEHYNIINNVLQCLMKTNCSITNVKCELVLHCINFLEKTVDDMSFSQQWISNHTKVNGQQCHVEKSENQSGLNTVVKFSGYVNLCTNHDEIEQLSNMVKQWRSKYHFSREECIKLSSVQQKLLAHSHTINNLIAKHSNQINNQI